MMVPIQSGNVAMDKPIDAASVSARTGGNIG